MPARPQTLVLYLMANSCSDLLTFWGLYFTSLLQTSKVPRPKTSLCIGTAVGFEPISSVLETDILPIELSPHMEQYTGFEPVPPAWKAGMLAIEHQYCMVLAYGYNPFPREPQSRVLSLHQSRYMYKTHF